MIPEGIAVWTMAPILALCLAGTAMAETLRPTPVGWFTDNGDRQALQVLRDRPEADLTAVERAILTAANRVGWIEIKGCNRGSNAILIRVGDRDAVVTSRHLIAGKWYTDIQCPADQMDTAVFYMNYSYQAPEYDREITKTTLHATAALDGDPLNFSAPGYFMTPANDWLVFYLTDSISDQPMPEGTFGAGQPRGAMAFSKRRPTSGEIHVIGYDGRFGQENGWQFSWQACRQVQTALGLADTLYIDCDVAPGASSSLLATLENGELTFQGLVTGSSEPLAGTDVPVPKGAYLWNVGTSSAVIQRELWP
ncbi:MAG: hypothetical protein WAT09_18650 [Paracoccaceae bacterium]